MMDPTLEGTLPDAGAMDLYASIPPSGPPIEQLVSLGLFSIIAHETVNIRHGGG